MDAGIPKVDVHQIWITPQKNPPGDFELSPINQCGRLRHILQESAADPVRSRLFEQLQIRKWIAVAIFPKFRDHKSIDISKRRYLAIDVEHLRLEKIGAIAGYQRFQIKVCSSGPM